jgi:hypothetical protein
MKQKKTQGETGETDARIDEILLEMRSIEAMLDGALLTKHNRVARKDGIVHISPAHYVFQYRGADGRRKWKAVPAGARKAVERLVEAGRRYRALESEYSALMTERALVADVKKNAGELRRRPVRSSKT